MWAPERLGWSLLSSSKSPGAPGGQPLSAEQPVQRPRQQTGPVHTHRLWDPPSPNSRSLMVGLSCLHGPWRSCVLEPQPPRTPAGITQAQACRGLRHSVHLVSGLCGLVCGPGPSGVTRSSSRLTAAGWACACRVCFGDSFSGRVSVLWLYFYFGLFACCFLYFILFRLNCFVDNFKSVFSVT